MTQWPAVDVIMPVLNEENYLADAVAAVINQNYPGALSIALAVGPSTDRTLEVAQNLAAADSRIIVVANPSGRTPDALNAAIGCGHAEIVVRVDAHSELCPGYIEQAVRTLQQTNADNVGGVMGAQGRTPFEQAVAAAMTSPLGVGAARSHTGGQAGPAETVYLGVFKRSALQRVGGYDPDFTRAQDWEMNHRIRQSGGLVWFDPALYVTYRPRPSLRALASQYFQYGTWRREVMRAHPQTRRAKSALRYFAPPAALLGSSIGLVLGLCGIALGQSWLLWAFAMPASYLAFTALSSVLLARNAGRGAGYLPMVLATMQLAWGVGFLTSRPQR